MPFFGQILWLWDRPMAYMETIGSSAPAILFCANFWLSAMGSSGSKQEVSRYRGLGAWHGMTWPDMAWHGKGLELPMNYSIELNYLSSISLYLALILTDLCPFVPCLQVLKRWLWGGSMILNLAPFTHDSKYARSEEMIPFSAPEETTFFLLKTHTYIYIS